MPRRKASRLEMLTAIYGMGLVALGVIAYTGEVEPLALGAIALLLTGCMAVIALAE